MHYLQEVKKWLGEITEIFLLLIALGVVVEILFGSAGTAGPGETAFFTGVVTNLTALIKNLGSNGLVGLIALAIILYLFQRRKVFVEQH
jgi:hypothetical protein